MPVTVPDTAVAFEFINGDGFWKLTDSIKADQIEDGVDDRFGYAGILDRAVMRATVRTDPF